jgi:hypothetical protein
MRFRLLIRVADDAEEAPELALGWVLGWTLIPAEAGGDVDPCPWGGDMDDAVEPDNSAWLVVVK